MRKPSERLLPGKTLLVCQDFKYWGTYWVPIFMMMIRSDIEPVHNVLSASTVSFRLTKPISPDLLSSLPDHVADLPTRESLDKITAAAALLEAAGDAKGACQVSLAQVSFLAHKGDDVAAADAFRQVQRGWPLSTPTALLDRTRAYLNEEKGQQFTVPIRLQAVQAWRTLRRRAFGVLKRLTGRL